MCNKRIDFAAPISRSHNTSRFIRARLALRWVPSTTIFLVAYQVFGTRSANVIAGGCNLFANDGWLVLVVELRLKGAFLLKKHY